MDSSAPELSFRKMIIKFGGQFSLYLEVPLTITLTILLSSFPSLHSFPELPSFPFSSFSLFLFSSHFSFYHRFPFSFSLCLSLSLSFSLFLSLSLCLSLLLSLTYGRGSRTRKAAFFFKCVFFQHSICSDRCDWVLVVGRRGSGCAQLISVASLYS